MVEILGTDEFEAWYLGLNAVDARAVGRLVDLLEQTGVSLGHPYSSALKGTKYALRELRHRGEPPLRIIYTFDPWRAAVLLIGGDKKGDDRFYERIIPLAERIWEQYLQEQQR
jgi:hypothetical protein